MTEPTKRRMKATQYTLVRKNGGKVHYYTELEYREGAWRVVTDDVNHFNLGGKKVKGVELGNIAIGITFLIPPNWAKAGLVEHVHITERSALMGIEQMSYDKEIEVD